MKVEGIGIEFTIIAEYGYLKVGTADNKIYLIIPANDDEIKFRMIVMGKEDSKKVAEQILLQSNQIEL